MKPPIPDQIMPTTKTPKKKDARKASIQDETINVTRVEVIDEKGRSYVNWDARNHVQVQLQDDGRTLKVFIIKANEPRKF